MVDDIDIEELWNRRMTRFYRIATLGLASEEQCRNMAEIPSLILWWAGTFCLFVPFGWWLVFDFFWPLRS